MNKPSTESSQTIRYYLRQPRIGLAFVVAIVASPIIGGTAVWLYFAIFFGPGGEHIFRFAEFGAFISTLLAAIGLVLIGVPCYLCWAKRGTLSVSRFVALGGGAAIVAFWFGVRPLAGGGVMQLAVQVVLSACIGAALAGIIMYIAPPVRRQSF